MSTASDLSSPGTILASLLALCGIAGFVALELTTDPAGAPPAPPPAGALVLTLPRASCATVQDIDHRIAAVTPAPTTRHTVTALCTSTTGEIAYTLVHDTADPAPDRPHILHVRTAAVSDPTLRRAPDPASAPGAE